MPAPRLYKPETTPPPPESGNLLIQSDVSDAQEPRILHDDYGWSNAFGFKF